MFSFFKVGPAAEFAEAVEKFSTHPDPTVKQVFLADPVMNPALGVHRGMKHAAWSPLGCDSCGRCLLACLTLDNRLTVHSSHRRLDWSVLVNLSEKYNQRLKEQGYVGKDNGPAATAANLLDFGELQRRFRMQTPLRMEWSSVYTVKTLQPNNACVDIEIVLLAVLMENGDLVLWKFPLPFSNGGDVCFHGLVESGVSSPSDLAWWEYENEERRMSGLIVGSQAGPLKIMPVSLAGVKGFATLRHPVILWKESDQIAMENLKCVSLVHPIQKTSCSLIVASRGCYVFWCLLTISPVGLSVRNSHVAALSCLPVVSLVVSRHGGAVYACSTHEWITKLTPAFTQDSLIFKQEEMAPPESVAARRIHGIAASYNSAYIALVSTQGCVGGHHPANRTYQVHFMALKTPGKASALLLESPVQNLYKMADLLDLVRWQILKDKRIPARLMEELERRTGDADAAYLWRFKLFLVRMLHQSLQSPHTEHRWKPLRKHCGGLARQEDGREGGRDTEDGDSREGEAEAEEVGEGPEVMPDVDEEEEMVKAQALIDSIETRLMRENMKKVLGVVYLNTCITQNTSIPTCGLMEYLSGGATDRDLEVQLA